MTDPAQAFINQVEAGAEERAAYMAGLTIGEKALMILNLAEGAKKKDDIRESVAELARSIVEAES